MATQKLLETAVGPAMDEATYKQILVDNDKYDARAAQTVDTDEFTDEGWKLHQDMAHGKVRWYGSYAQDLWCYLRNNNPIFSSCYSHPLHPISRSERYYLYFTIIIFKMALSILITQAGHCQKDGIVSCPLAQAAKQSDKNADGDFLDLCCTCSDMGILVVFDSLGYRIGATLIAFLGGVIYAVTMFQFAACNCAQKVRSEKRRHTLEHRGYAVIGVVTFLVILMAIKPFDFCVNHGLMMSAFETFLAAQGASWIGATVFVPGVCCFTLLNHKEKAKEEKGEVNWYVTWQQYQEKTLMA